MNDSRPVTDGQGPREPTDRSRKAPDVPGLLLHHFDELHRVSGLSVEVIREQGYCSAWGAHDLAPYGFSDKQLRGFPALVLPVHPPDGSNGLAAIKPDRPRTERKSDGSERIIKYEWPAGTRLRLDVPVRCVPLLADPNVSLGFTEGGKKAAAAAQYGFCMISLNGVWGWRDKVTRGPLADFDRIPLAGRHVFLCFDSDVMVKPDVEQALAAFREFLESRDAVVSLVYLPTGKDGAKVGLDDYLLTHTAAEFRALIGKAPAGVSSLNSHIRTVRFGNDDGGHQGERPLPPVPAFPLDTLPGLSRRLVKEAAASCVCPPEFVALPLLAITGGIIGKRLSLYYRRDWQERPILWTAVIGHPGTAKSPALDRAREPMEQLQKDAHAAAVTAQETYDGELANWQKGSTKPVSPPPGVHYYTTDATAEAINRILGDAHSQTPGLTVVEDELTRWVSAFDAYRGGKGGDRQKWLTLWSGSNLKTDRASRVGEYTSNPVVCVTGGIQPDRIPALAADAGARDGFTERFLYAWPDAKAPRRGTGEVSEASLAGVRRLFKALRGTPAQSQVTAVVNLSDDARAVFDGWYDLNAERVDNAGGSFQGVYAKLPRQVLRLALVLHALAHGGEAETERVSAETMADAIDLGDYFTAHAFRVLSRFSSGLSGTVAKVFRAYEKAGDGDDGADLTTIHNALGRHLKAVELRAAVDELSRLGLLEPCDVSEARAGRPPERYRTARTREGAE